MKKGDIVEVWDFPLSETGEKEKAKLIKFIRPMQEGMEYWVIKFLFDGMVANRVVKNKDY